MCSKVCMSYDAESGFAIVLVFLMIFEVGMTHLGGC